MNRSMFLAARALLAVLLMVGFYALAISIAAGLLWIPWAEITMSNRIHIKLLIVCVLGAGIILWSIFPRADRFEAPGPLLERNRHPRLFRLIDHVADATGQENASEVYLVPDVNAWVTERGGIMGFGSRRVMGLGLPLLQNLTAKELEAVLAHEFGHYHGGDTKLGPWVYKTRSAIGRTLEGLEHHSGLLRKPFEWYGAMFLRVSHAVSRAQEFAADRMAAEVAGARALASGLRKICGAAAAFPSYWSSEVQPVLSSGYRPPLAQGFQHFTSVSSIAKAMEEQINEAVGDRNGDPLDTHPPLSARLEALATLAPGPESDDAPALDLLNDVEKLERDMVAHLAGDAAPALEPVGWEEVGRRVLVPGWDQAVQKNAAPLSGLSAGSLPDRIADLDGFERSLPNLPQGMPADERRRWALWLLGAALGAALARSGWTIHSMPGEPILAEGPAGSMDPFQAVQSLTQRGQTAEAWRFECDRLGISQLSLAPA